MGRRRGVAEYLLAVIGTIVVWQLFKVGLISSGMPRLVVIIVPPVSIATLLILRRTARHTEAGGPMLGSLMIIVAEAALLAVAVGLVASAVSAVLFGGYLP